MCMFIILKRKRKKSWENMLQLLAIGNLDVTNLWIYLAVVQDLDIFI